MGSKRRLFGFWWKLDQHEPGNGQQLDTGCGRGVEQRGGVCVDQHNVERGGIYRLASWGTVQRSGGTIQFTGTLDNTGTSLVLDEVTGTWNLAGGRIVGGAIVGTNGAGLVVTADSVLDGVTLNADLTVPGGAGCGYTRQLTVTNGLVLNSTLTLARYGVGSSAVQLTFAGSQTLGGSGQVVFVNSGVCTGYQESVYVWASGTLTIGPGITIHGQRGVVGNSSLPLVNQGTIRSDAGQTMIVTGSSVTNWGTIIATGEGVWIWRTWWTPPGCGSRGAGV